MRAVIIAAGHSDDPAAANDRLPMPLFPLIDRPFLQHVVEALVRLEVVRFDFILSRRPEQFEQFLGDGKRWGVRVVYHLARDPARPYRPLRTLDFGAEAGEAFLLGHADRLPPLAPALLKNGGGQPGPLLYYSREGAPPDAVRARQWTGWALLRPKHLEDLPADAAEDELTAYLADILSREGAWCEIDRPLPMRTFRDMLEAHRAVLDNEFPGLLTGGKQTDAGRRLGRNVRLHPTARVVPPFYVGENCVVGAGVQIGPRAAVGRNCVLEANCRVTNAVILPDSYVGEALELSDVIVANDRLIDARGGAEITVHDPTLLASLADPPLLRAAGSVLERAAALVLLVLASPVLLLTALWLKLRRGGPVLYRRRAVRLPAPHNPAAWRTFAVWSFCPDERVNDPAEGGTCRTTCSFLLQFLPALANVAKGDLCFVGLPARTSDEVLALPDDWRALYLRGKAGVVTDGAVRYGDRPTEDERYATEALYTGLAGWGRDVRTLGRYLARTLFGRPLPRG